MDIIKANKPKLIRWLHKDKLILQHVQSKDLITPHEYARVNIIQDSSEKTIEILDLMLGKGDEICWEFLEMLKDDDVNESSPDLRTWIATVNTSSSACSSPSSSSSSSSSIPDSEEFLWMNRDDLIQKVKSVTEILDRLTLTDEMMANVHAQPTDQMKMRKVLDYTNSKKASDLLIEVLKDFDPDLIEDLTSN